MTQSAGRQAVRVTTGSRLHIALLDVGHATHRRYGGVGLAIGWPRVVAVAVAAAERRLRGLPGEYAQGAEQMITALETEFGTRLPGDVTVPEAPEPHIGLGSKTAVLLSVGRALTALNGLPATPRQLWRASGRGGTSGIGVHRFYRGGLLVDGGHSASGPRSFGPSSAGAPADVPPLLAALPVPPSWRVTLVLPAGRRIAGAAEREVFGAAPVPDIDVLRAVAAVYHGLVAAVATDDLVLAGEALEVIMSTGFKRLELAHQSPPVRELAVELAAAGRPVGMSSMGPLLYVLHRVGDGTAETVAGVAAERGAAVLGTAAAAAGGHVLEHQTLAR
jgi:beta-ribofuranosylaminobenzene 5'-phosphate synthase